MEKKSFIDLIGNTPLVHLRRASEETGCTILGKAEFLNPGQSVKDRAALFIIADAEQARACCGRAARSSRAPPAIPASASPWSATRKGYRTVIVIPETQSQEKKDMLRLCGAELIVVPAVPYQRPQQLRALFGPARRGAAPRRCRTARSGPTSSTMSPTGDGHIRDHRPRDLGADRGQGRRLRLLGRHRRHARRRRDRAQGAQQGRQDRARRPGRRGALQLLCPWRAQGRGQLDHRGHRPGPDHREPRGRAGRHGVQHQGRGGAAAGLRSGGRGGPGARRLDRDQPRGRDPARRRSWAPATPS